MEAASLPSTVRQLRCSGGRGPAHSGCGPHGFPAHPQALPPGEVQRPPPAAASGPLPSPPGPAPFPTPRSGAQGGEVGLQRHLVFLCPPLSPVSLGQPPRPASKAGAPLAPEREGLRRGQRRLSPQLPGPVFQACTHHPDPKYQALGRRPRHLSLPPGVPGHPGCCPGQSRACCSLPPQAAWASPGGPPWGGRGRQGQPPPAQDPLSPFPSPRGFHGFSVLRPG